MKKLIMFMALLVFGCDNVEFQEIPVQNRNYIRIQDPADNKFSESFDVYEFEYLGRRYRCFEHRYSSQMFCDRVANY